MNLFVRIIAPTRAVTNLFVFPLSPHLRSRYSFIARENRFAQHFPERLDAQPGTRRGG
jgi:hypothetical protein